MRFRVTALAALAVAAVLAGAAVGLVVAHRAVLMENLDESLAEVAAALAADAAGGPPPATLAPVGDDDAVAQVVANGEVVAATANAAGAPPLAGARGGDAGPTRTVDRVATGEDGPFRLVSRTVEGPAWAPAGDAVVHVAAPLDDIEDSTALLARSLALTVPVATAVLAALIWWLVGRTLRPVESMRREAAAIGGSELARRVPEPAGDDEVARLARTLNGMLERIEAAVGGQQRFVADASHELRSPLARMRAELEVDLAQPSTADPAATSRSVLDETVGMQALVDDLLVLARHDAGAAAGPRGLVDLDDLVGDEVRRLRAGGRVAVDAREVGAAQVSGDAARLGRALGNVVDNAARHARSTVTLSLAERDGHAVLAIADDGPGIPPARREEVFERFSRLDDARGSGTGGTGLGLAIAREIVTAHGGTIAVDPTHRSGARIVIALPLADPTA